MMGNHCAPDLHRCANVAAAFDQRLPPARDSITALNVYPGTVWNHAVAQSVSMGSLVDISPLMVLKVASLDEIAAQLSN